MAVSWEQATFEGLEAPAPRKRRKPRGVEKGNPFAQKVADYVGTERRVLNGKQDKGDLVLQSTTAEIKCTGRGQPLRLSEWMNEAKAEARNAGTPRRYCVIARRTGYDVSEAFHIMPLWMAVELGLVE